MRYLMLLLFLVMFTGLAACTTVTPQAAATTDTAVKYSCAAAATSLSLLTTANEAGKLTASEKVQVNHVLSVVSPICLAYPEPTLDTLQAQALAQAVSQAGQLAARHK